MTSFRERLVIPWDWWIRGLVVAVTIAWIVRVAANAQAAWFALVLSGALVGLALVQYSRTQIKVEDNSLFAGRAQISREFVGTVTILDSESFHQLMGPQSNALAFMVTKPYVHTGVMVEITDPADRTPYWLIASRNPEELAAALSPKVNS